MWLPTLLKITILKNSFPFIKQLYPSGFSFFPLFWLSTSTMGSKIGEPHRKLNFTGWEPLISQIASEQTHSNLPIIIHKEREYRWGKIGIVSYLSHCEAFLCAVDSVLCSYLTAHSLASSPWQSYMPGKERKSFNMSV